MTQKFRTALFAGSFNPFTIGHKSIVERTLAICDRVVVAVGYNPAKPIDDADKRVAAIRKIFADNQNVEAALYSGLTVDFARKCGADFMVRGVRGVSDFEYERNLAEVNLRISGIETMLMPALPELSYISSSTVRELAANGYDVSRFLPEH